MDGFNDANLQSQVRMKGFSSLNELLVTLKSVTLEDRGSSSSSIGSKSTGSGQQHHAPKPSVTYEQRRCSNCNMADHKTSECRRRNPAAGSCFEYGSNLHQVRNCPLKKREEAPSRAPANSTTHQIETPALVPARRATLRLKFKPTDEYYSLFQGFLDLGSPVSFLRVDCVPPEVIKPICSKEKFYEINNSELELLGILSTEIELNNIKLSVTFYIISAKSMTDFCLLGRDVLCNPRVKLTIDQGEVA